MSKNVLVVGASSGIGKVVAEQLIAAGHEVYTASRRDESPEGAHHINLDITSDFSEIDGLPEELHGVVYCPGTINLKPFQRLSQEDFQHDFEVNVLGATKVLQAALKPLKKGKNGSVVLFSTVAVQSGMTFHASVAMAKGAIEGLTRSLAAEWVASNIRVNAIAPSLTDTPLAAQLLSTPERKEASDKRHPLGRVGTSEEIASMATYLLSDHASWITGQIFHLDGGMSVVRG